jgi:hypothetical protein
MRWLMAGLLGALLLGCSGGGNPMPATVPAKGKVLDQKGNPLTAGSVRFDPKAAGELTTTSEIGADGAFSMKTFRDRDQADGVPPGTYTVTIIRPIVSGNQPPDPVVLKEPVVIPAEGKGDLSLRIPAGVK